MLEQIFLKVIDMSRAASMVIVIVFLARILLKRFPKYISYMLWGVVFFRLLCPVTLESEISPVPKLKPAFYDYISERDVAFREEGQDELFIDGFTAIDPGRESENVPETESVTAAEFPPIENIEVPGAAWQELLILFGKYMWVSGIGILFLYCVISVVKMRYKVSVSVPLKDNIYVTDERISPFVMGILKPRIYLPEGLSGKEQEYIILHERFHIRRLDHVIKPLAFAAVCIHWFNPLVWIAFLFFCKDMEMSCDEAVIKRMGESVRADYAASLLALSTQYRIIRGIPVDFGEGDTKDRVKNLAAFRKTKKSVAAVLVAGVVILIVCLASTRKTPVPDTDEPLGVINAAGGEEIPDMSDQANEKKDDGASVLREEPEKAEQIAVSLDITEHYIKHVGDPSNLYYIDANNVLWGSGDNNYGQLGQGTQDTEFHEDMVKIADNVVHVDYSQNGFVIFLTKDHRLYGMGNAGCGALQQYEEFSPVRRERGEQYAVTTPILLIEDVIYACCGREDIVCLKEDGTVWTWGIVYNDILLSTPKEVIQNAVLVTGGWYNHAVLLQDGTVWTWGYNDAENCGVADLLVVTQPTKVAEGVVMIWTDLAVEGDPQPEADDIVMAWTGRLKYNTEYENIVDFGGVYPYHLQNTVIQKADGSYWVCGRNVGTEEKEVFSREGSIQQRR